VLHGVRARAAEARAAQQVALTRGAYSATGGQQRVPDRRASGPTAWLRRKKGHKVDTEPPRSAGARRRGNHQRQVPKGVGGQARARAPHTAPHQLLMRTGEGEPAVGHGSHAQVEAVALFLSAALRFAPPPHYRVETLKPASSPPPQITPAPVA
jgi:hypothetical protein